VKQHLKQGKIVENWCHRKASSGAPCPTCAIWNFLARQTKVVLRNCGVIDPLSLDEYIARDGYGALARVLTTLKPDDVIEVVKQSGLRGRGGAGFPNVAEMEPDPQGRGTEKFVLCNGDEGDPGAFMDRSVLEGDPHSVVEAMAIGAYAIALRAGLCTSAPSTRWPLSAWARPSPMRGRARAPGNEHSGHGV